MMCTRNTLSFHAPLLDIMISPCPTHPPVRTSGGFESTSGGFESTSAGMLFRLVFFFFFVVVGFAFFRYLLSHYLHSNRRRRHHRRCLLMVGGGVALMNTAPSTPAVSACSNDSVRRRYVSPVGRYYCVRLYPVEALS